tara:strand:- start:343 stop:501 length:159 start_codon:yes stop_codon:yes gene_type:complete
VTKTDAIGLDQVGGRHPRFTCDIAGVFLEDVGRRLEDVLEDVHPSRTEPWKT